MYLNRKLIISEYPIPRWNRENQFAPPGEGVKELIFRTTLYIVTNTGNHYHFKRLTNLHST